MRITGGDFKGRRLKGPKGRFLRPTSDMVRKAIFDILGPRGVEGKRVLDLFAGSGAIGLEALSRGAQRVVFVEKDRGVVELIKENVKAVGLEDRVRVYNLDAKKAVRVLKEKGEEFDLIFMDPPYRDQRLVEQVLTEILDKGILVPGGIITIEHPAVHQYPALPGLTPLGRRRYGDTSLSLFIREA